MAKLAVRNIKDLNDYPKVVGFILYKNGGEICDVTLPASYEVVTKTIISGNLTKLEFLDEKKNHFIYED